MVENIIRHIGHKDPGVPVQDRIRAAAHEVQRPVFYAILIIITAYLPIYTLQSVEGRLFRPMAWTVGFALLGAMIFSVTLAPILVSFLFRKEVARVAQSGGCLAYETLPDGPDMVRASPQGDGRCCGAHPGRQYFSGGERHDRIGIPAPPG